MISIRKSVDDLSRQEDLEKREALCSAIRDCYTMAIQSSAHYAVEVDTGLLGEFRGHLKAIEKESRDAASAEQLHAIQSSFRGELREYRDKSTAQLQKMRQELENATAAMTIFAESVASNGDDHEQEVGSQLHSLESTALSNSIAEIRTGIGASVAGIQSSVEQMKRSNQIVVAQLQDEIRALHFQIEVERKILFTDRSSGAWNRQKIDIHLDNLLRQNQPFCLLLVSIRNLKRIESRNSRTIVEGTLQALVGRFSALAGEDAAIARWSEDQFVAVLDVLPSRAIALSAEAARTLSGNYAVQENGHSHTIAVQSTAGVIDRNSGADAATFRQKLDQLASAISGA